MTTTLLLQEAIGSLTAAIHLCNRKQGSRATREVLSDFLEQKNEELPLSRTVSMPAQADTAARQEYEEEPVLMKAQSVSSQPVYRGRWADLDSDESDG
jgi:type II secretory pathway component PulL